MDFKHLHTFLTLAEIKNFTKTASVLHYAQSNVTTQIKQLETELEVPLFHRIGKTVSLTVEGEKLVPFAKQILSLSNDAISTINPNITHPITIGASESICISYLPGILHSFHDAYPEIVVKLKVLDTTDFYPALTNHEIDLAVCMGNRFTQSQFLVLKEKPESIGCFALPMHPLAKKTKVSASDFEMESFLLTGTGCYYRKLFEQEMCQQSITITPILETGSIQIIKESLLCGLGISVLPDCVLSKELKDGRIQKLDYETHYPVYTSLVCHKDLHRSKELDAFLLLAQDFIC